jgi:acetyl-CoA carboxylase carboxyl transferase subunit beta
MKDIFKRHPRYPAQREQFEALPENLWVRCPRCEELVYSKELESNYRVCPKCKYHFGLTARERIAATLDEGTFREYDERMRSVDPLSFQSSGEIYAEKLEQYSQKSGSSESFLYGTGTIEGVPVVLGVTEFKYAGGSMGAVFGEKLVRAIELGIREGLPLVTISTSGGARMQEGTASLMQMAKTVAALNRFKERGLPYFSIMVDPCLGGVTASFAMLGDVNIAEPGAYIGFAGRRVIEQTMRQKLPQDAATSEFLLKHGMVDQVVQRQDIPALLGRLIRMYVTCNVFQERRSPVGQSA